MSSLSTSDKKVLSTVKNGGVTPKETLTPFYGKDTDKVLKTAKVARLSASGLAVPDGNPKVDAILERSDIRNLQVVSPGSGQNEGSKEANKAEWNVARAHVNAGLERGVPVTPVKFGGSDSYFNRVTGEIQLGDKANANHEVSHPLNPTLLEPGGKSSAWLNENFNEAYYLGNNGELSAALGSLKRGAYQQFGDLSEPGAMGAFLEREDVKDLMNGRPTRGASALRQVLSSDATDFLQGLQYLRNRQKAGTITDEEAQRLNVTESALQNPDYLKQLVRNDPTDYAPDARKEVMADEAGGTVSKKVAAKKSKKQEFPRYETYADLEAAVLERADTINRHGSVIETPETAQREEALRQMVRGHLLGMRRARRADGRDTADLDDKIGRVTTKGDRERDAEAAAKFLNMDRDEAILHGISTLDNKYLRSAAHTVNALLKTAEMMGTAGAAGAAAPSVSGVKAPDLRAEPAGRPTRHRVFPVGGADKSVVSRVTGEPQILDMERSGVVRAKAGKMRGGRHGEVHWSQGDGRRYIKAGQYVLEAPVENVEGLEGGLALDKLSHVWTERNGAVIDILPEVQGEKVTYPVTPLPASLFMSDAAIRQTPWYSDLSARYGERGADAAVRLVQSDRFKDYFWGAHPADTLQEARLFEAGRDIMNKLGGNPLEGRGLIGGSAAIGRWGTIQRPSAVAHDIDFESHILNPSLVSWVPAEVWAGTNGREPQVQLYPNAWRKDLAEYTVPQSWYNTYVRPLRNRFNVENAPIFQLIRESFPETHGNARILPWSQALKNTAEDRYQEGIFRHIDLMNGPQVGRPGAHQFYGTRIHGIPVDIFLRDTAIRQVDDYGTSPYAPANTAFAWKRAYMDEAARRGREPREKDLRDFRMYQPYSAANPVIDPSTMHGQFAPAFFGDQLVDNAGLPQVHTVETYPGSGVRIPMIMNTRGEYLYPFNSSGLRQDAKGGNVRADEAGGDVAPDADPAVSDKPPVEEREPSPEPSAPARIIINPKVFKDKRDGLCVAYNEAFRVIMEMNGFDPQAEPTEEQRKFFSDTAYADDERMLRRTILARICTFDDSVKNPTDEQLDEALEFLETVMEIGAPQSEEEQANVQRIHDMIAEIRKAPRPEEAPAEEAPAESEAPPVGAVFGGYTRKLRREQKVLDEYLSRTAGEDFMGEVGEGLRTEVEAEPPTEVSGGISRRAEEDSDEEEENRLLPRADLDGGETKRPAVPRGSAKTDDTYVTNTAVVMPEAEARKMGVVTQGFEHVGKDQVAIPFEDFRSNGTVVDAAELLAESYGSKEAAEAAVAKSMANRAKRYPGGVPSEAAMSDPESVPVVPAGSRPGPWDEAYLSHAARAGHWNLKTVKSGEYLRTAGYIPGLSLGLIPTRVLGTSSPSIEVRRMLNSQVGETGESAGNGRIVTISDTANPNKPGWYASDEGYRAAALGSVKGWLTANERMPGEGEDLAAVMAAAHRDRAGLKRGKIDKNGKDFLAAVAKAYEAERGGSASKKDKEILAAARDMDMWGQVVGARRYDRYSTTV